ncbi:MAG: 2-oxoacid:ferredoxin oxidoreductase subunit gamma [Chloroflexota bacterium]
MHEEIIISGFGGQGALFAGQLLAYAGMNEGKHVTWIPSYGPEMRGGTAHCTVVISDEPIGSPLVRHPSVAIVMNNPSLDKYQPLVKPGGVLIVNSSLITQPITREDIRVALIPASAVADELGDSRLMNIVLLGALLALVPILPLEAIDRALADHIPERHRHLLPANMQALRRGAALAMEGQVARPHPVPTG